MRARGVSRRMSRILSVICTGAIMLTHGRTARSRHVASSRPPARPRTECGDHPRCASRVARVPFKRMVGGWGEPDTGRYRNRADLDGHYRCEAGLDRLIGIAMASSERPGFLFELIFVDLPVQGAAADFEYARRFLLVPMHRFEHADDVSAL